MSTADSGSFSVSVVAPIVVSGVPQWLTGKAINEWVTIPGSSMGQMDLTDLVNAGLCSGTGGDIGFGNPTSFSALLYIGGCLRKADSDFLMFGGGGARAWAGNEVRGLRLSEDAPRWACRSQPATALPFPGLIWYNSYNNTTTLPAPIDQHPDPTSQFMRDLFQPNARHAYWQPKFHDGLDKFFITGCRATWERDSSAGITPQPVRALDWTTKAWAAPGTYPSFPLDASADSHMQCKHPTTEKFYLGMQNRLYEFDPATSTWALKYNDGSTAFERRVGVIDSTRNKLLMVGQGLAGVQDVPFTVDLTSFTSTQAVFTGPFAGTIHEQNLYWAAGFVYDPLIDKYLFYQDDGFMYTITYVDDATYLVDRLTTTGAPPAGNTANFVGNVGIWGKMQYVPNLKGVVLLPGGDTVPTYFIKTAN